MASKYDLYWDRRVEDLRRLIEAAAQETPSELDISDIQSFGKRTSWRGRAVVTNKRVIAAYMAHAVSLAHIVAEQGLCTAHPTGTFAFTVDAGCHLYVAYKSAGQLATDPSNSRLQSAMPRQVIEPRERWMTETPSNIQTARTDSATTALTLNPTVACTAVSGLLERLPVYRAPSEVPFTDGLYFFYQRGEVSPHTSNGRVVRVGNHPRRDGRLIGRLKEHYASRQNAKNGSVFRLLVGGALIRRDDPESLCLAPGPGQGHWERHRQRECNHCAPYEQRLAKLVDSDFWFRAVRIDRQAERNPFEVVLIATLAACMLCRPSEGWLGRFACSPIVRGSGLWNREFVGGPILTSDNLERFQELVENSLGR